MGKQPEKHDAKKWEQFDAKGEGVQPHLADDKLMPSPNGVEVSFDGNAVDITLNEPPKPHQ